MPDITFDQYTIDLADLACARLLSQFNQSTTGIQPYLTALVNQTQDWNNITLTVFEGRYLEEAIGVQLNTIGRIVGQDRPLVDGSEILYFAWDSPTNSQGWDGNAGWFTTNAPVAGLIPASDLVYRQYIYGKIFKNQVTGASIPEVLQFIKITLNLDASIENLGYEPMAVNVIVPSDTPESYVKLLGSKTSDNTVQNNYFIPVADTVRINSIILRPVPAFGFDNNSPTRAGWDAGKWTIGTPVE